MSRRTRWPSCTPKSRDNARSPMQWNDSAQAGFTSGEPWIKVNANYKAINVEQALADPNSIFYYYQKLIRLRRQHPIIVYGTYDLILDAHEQIYAFTRTLEDEHFLWCSTLAKARLFLPCPLMSILRARTC